AAGGVLHRDVKPTNCFVDPDGTVKVGDYGLSVSTLTRDDSLVTASGAIMGTPAFASPEQLRGDPLDVRADVYSVGATLHALLTGKPPIGGDNVVQVVANAMHQAPSPLRESRADVPAGLERVVLRCLAKSADDRYADHASLRDALLPFSSRVPEPASMKQRAAAGWVDYLAAFLVPYVVLMITVGSAEFHVLPFVERTIDAYRFHLICFGLGFLYFAALEGVWGAGIGKRLKGLRVVRTRGGRPGLLRALARIAVPIGFIEAIRIPLLLVFLSASDMSEWTVGQTLLHIGISNVAPWAVVLLGANARRENGFATAWDRITGTRVIVAQTETAAAAVEGAVTAGDEVESRPFGPYRVNRRVIPEAWLGGDDPVLDRPVWMLRRDGTSEPSLARRAIARPGRLRWLQSADFEGSTWDAFEASPGQPLLAIVAHRGRLPWSRLRHWLHDLTVELRAAARDRTLPTELGLDHVWIAADGRAMLLDRPWPSDTPAKRIDVTELAGQQRFLSAVAGHVESTSLPLHARGVLENLGAARFEKLSFLAGVLRGLLDQPAEIHRGIRAGSVFLLPVYVCLMACVGYFEDGSAAWGGRALAPLLFCVAVVLGAFALVQLLEFPFRRTVAHAIHRIALVDARGARAGAAKLYLRWAVVWLPLVVAMAGAWALVRTERIDLACAVAGAALLAWIAGAVHTVLRPTRGIADRIAGTWVVRH
ncbi:MAG: RDD family protein, partial [Planctomycetota bacterium]